MALGVILAGCNQETLIDGSLNIPEDAKLMYQSDNDTHYSIYYITESGSQVSASVPYIYENENHIAYEVIDAIGTGSYRHMTVSRRFIRQFQDRCFNFIEEECRVVLDFKDLCINYNFTHLSPTVTYKDNTCYHPSFELIDYSLTEIGEETCDDNRYLCTELKTVLRAYQGEKVFDFVKTVKIRQKLCNISFDVGVNPWYGKEN